MIELNKIYCENCLDTMARMPDEFIDLTVTSPPYDGLRDYNGYVFDFEKIAKELFRVTKKGGVVVWVVNDQTINGCESLTSFKQAIYFVEQCGFNLHDTMIWQKISPFQHKNRYISCFEYMFVFSKGVCKAANLIKDRKNKWAGTQVHGTQRQVSGRTKPLSELQKSKKVKDYGSRYNIWDIAPVKTNRGESHPAPFPEKLARDHIYSWSNEGDLVYDPFMGSGTTAKMSHILKRRWIGSEISQEYVDIANKRLEKYLRQEVLDL